MRIREGFSFFDTYFNILIFGHFDFEILICGLAMKRSRLYLEYNIDQYVFSRDLNSVCIVYLKLIVYMSLNPNLYY